MAYVLTGSLTVTCDSEAEYLKVLADVQARSDIYLNIVGDSVARTITFDINQPE